MKSNLVSPTYLNLFPVLSVGLHLILPIKRIIYAPYTYLGILFILLGAVLNLWSVAQLQKHHTTIDFDRTPRELVIDGPYRISRNPIYLSGVILSLGIAVLLGSLITFAFPVVLSLILNTVYIPSEEAALERNFGTDYGQYKKRVRRWI